MTGIASILIGDVRDRLKELPDGCVQCVVTSPPYFGLRDYGTATWSGGNDPSCQHPTARGTDSVKQSIASACGHASKADKLSRRLCSHCGAERTDQQLGLESSPEDYVADLVTIFQEVRRVLRDDGVLYLNLGDSYSHGGNGGRNAGRWPKQAQNDHRMEHSKTRAGAKPKDLLMIPARVALALQADGWWVRSHIAWTKGNPMPESLKDRPTSAWESIFMLTKSASYFWDHHAVAETAVSTKAPGNKNGFKRDQRVSHATDAVSRESSENWNDLGGTRNLRNVWAINTKPYRKAHFATFPLDVPDRCIRAGTSEHGCCQKCGAPWRRLVEKGEPDREHQRASGGDAAGAYAGQAVKGYSAAGAQNASDVKRRILEGMRQKRTIGWELTCECISPGPPAPCLVLDPFAGSGTTGVAATRLGRDAVLIDLNQDYLPLMRERLGGVHITEFFWGSL